MDVYSEYAAAVLDIRKAEVVKSISTGAGIPPHHHPSSKKYLINSAMSALRSGSRRYLGQRPLKAGWTRDDHDIRFVVRLVESGSVSGRWWEHQVGPQQIE